MLRDDDDDDDDDDNDNDDDDDDDNDDDYNDDGSVHVATKYPAHLLATTLARCHLQYRRLQPTTGRREEHRHHWHLVRRGLRPG